uniref:Uncharacterized protein n=1 Tax=viral metagenome TaxID=1070528 RepID=A0A6C0LKH3_9ZZZZ
MPDTEDIFGPDELVIQRKGSDAIAGGFKITSFINSADEIKKQSGGGIAAFKDLAVPAGLFLMQRVASNTFTSSSDAPQVIDEKLHSKLIDLVDDSPKKNKKKPKTRRKNKSSTRKKGTRKKN